MSIRIAAALFLLPGAVLAQDEPQTVGVSVAGTVVEIPVDQAAEACGIDAGTLLAEWQALGTEMATMADTSVAADATDLAPDVAADTPMDSNLDGETPADGADATHEADGEPAVDVASDVPPDRAEESSGMETGAEATAVAGTEPGSVPGVSADGSMDAGVEATEGATGDDPATADAAKSEETTIGADAESSGGPATPTEGTGLSKAAVCEVSQETADSLGIATSG